MKLIENSSQAPAAPWFESDQLDSYMAAEDFDAEAMDFVRSMARDGGAKIDLADEIADLCDHAVAETDFYFDDGETSRVHDAWRRSSAVRRLAANPTIHRLLRAAYGRDPFPFQTLNFRRGSEQRLHSDTIHFSSLPERFMCGVWIALEDVGEGAGPLVYKPGSHRSSIVTMQDAGSGDRPSHKDYVELYEPHFSERMAAFDAPTERLMLKKGQAFVWAANLAHGGAPIQDPSSTRRSLVIHFYFSGCTYFTPMMSDTRRRRLRIRLPTDVRTGLWRWPRDGRKLVPVPVDALAGSVLKAVLRRPLRFR